MDDLIRILIRLDFEERNSGGSHRIFYKDRIEGIINLQKTKDGKAKSYQVKQVRNFLVNNNCWMMNKYETIIYWSGADAIYIAEMPELKGCIAHGDSPDEALKNIQQVSKEWLELANEKNWTIPEPKGRLIFA